MARRNREALIVHKALALSDTPSPELQYLLDARTPGNRRKFLHDDITRLAVRRVLKTRGVYALDDIPNGTPVQHRNPAIQGTGKTVWLCIGNCYRVQWSDGTYTETPVADLIVMLGGLPQHSAGA